MQGFTQKYTFVHLLNELPNGYEYSMKDWPLHVTLADVFAIEGNSRDILESLEKKLGSSQPVQSKVIGEKWFGEDRSVHVKLIDNTDELQKLHESIIEALANYGVAFNSPQYVQKGFVPHSTVQSDTQLEINDIVTFDSITLIDMFPDNDPYRRRILGTILLTGPEQVLSH